ncbi:hypothetical protein F8M41_018839 [Gigaspora margarita]|uniref:Uncharacterized protein n=1 Tax=Gigaspora margarita TaxID=4874 RepID=A0A8H4AKZ4_GIGMA|nr:hypothetical protein F8M41_018839 [Gigaspora margarita]
MDPLMFEEGDDQGWWYTYLALTLVLHSFNKWLIDFEEREECGVNVGLDLSWEFLKSNNRVDLSLKLGGNKDNTEPAINLEPGLSSVGLAEVENRIMPALSFMGLTKNDMGVFISNLENMDNAGLENESNMKPGFSSKSKSSMKLGSSLELGSMCSLDSETNIIESGYNSELG